MPKSQCFSRSPSLAAESKTARMKVRVTVTAVNMLIITPMARLTAKPNTG